MNGFFFSLFAHPQLYCGGGGLTPSPFPPAHNVQNLCCIDSSLVRASASSSDTVSSGHQFDPGRGPILVELFLSFYYLLVLPKDRDDLGQVVSLHNLTQSVRLFHFLYPHRGLAATAGRNHINKYIKDPLPPNWYRRTIAIIWLVATLRRCGRMLNKLSRPSISIITLNLAPMLFFLHAWKDTCLTLKWISFHNIDKTGHFYMKTFGQIRSAWEWYH